MIKPVIGRIDYETKQNYRLKTKPPNLRKVKGKEEWNMITQELPSEPTIEKPLHRLRSTTWQQRKIPHLVYVNDKDYIIFDQSHELMKADHLQTSL